MSTGADTHDIRGVDGKTLDERFEEAKAAAEAGKRLIALGDDPQ